ncbi:MAG: ferredoxin [Bacteroidales bacterium]|nr:ferredoxin [Bacteroidales bacterium]
MKITKVWLNETDDNCIVCGMCESIAPSVFEVGDQMAVIEGADYDGNADAIIEAVDSCPVSVIGIEKED